MLLINAKIYVESRIITRTISQDDRMETFESTIRSSYKERMVDALALGAEEGRDKLRKATGSRT